MVTAHPVHSAAGRRGCGTEVDFGIRGCIMLSRGPEQEMADVEHPALNVASYQVRIHTLQISRREHAAG